MRSGTSLKLGADEAPRSVISECVCICLRSSTRFLASLASACDQCLSCCACVGKLSQDVKFSQPCGMPSEPLSDQQEKRVLLSTG